jgi:hypothetical protein
MEAAWLVGVALGVCVKLKGVRVIKREVVISKLSVGEEVGVLLRGGESVDVSEGEDVAVLVLLPLVEEELLGLSEELPLVEGDLLGV